MTRHVGIVACSAEGAALAYRTLCAEGALVMGVHDHPEVSMHTHSLAEYVRHIDRGDWAGVGALMMSSATKLARAGADFVICPDNTIHQALPLVEPRSPIPWLSIARVVGAEAKARGFRKVGITGTRWLVDGPVYPDALDALGIGWLRPSDEERDTIDRLIMTELVRGITSDEGVVALQRVIRRMAGDGCDAVVLGCTELPIVMNDALSPLPTLDSTRLLARAALARATAAESR